MAVLGHGSSSHRDGAARHTAVPSCCCAVEKGWVVAGAEGLFLLRLMALLLQAGPQGGLPWQEGAWSRRRFSP